MKVVRIEVVKNKSQLADKCVVAESFLTRLRGWLGKAGAEAGEAIWIRPCNSIHMWMMRFPIDAVFVRPVPLAGGGKGLEVCSVHPRLRPWKFLPVTDLTSTEVIELPVGTIERAQLRAGDHLCIA